MLKQTQSLQISANGRYFVDRAGHPLFWLGDTQWNLFRCHTLEDVRTIFADRRAKGFAFIQVMLLGCGEDLFGGSLYHIAGKAVHGEAFPTKDLSAPNPAYFAHVDAVIHLAQEYGIYLAIGIDHPNIRLTNLSTARAYGCWLGSRYKDAPNIIWVAAYLAPEGENIPVIEELAAGLREGDHGSHLLTVHPDPADPVVSSGSMHHAEWLAFNCIQTFKSTHLLYDAVQTDYRRAPAKPVVLAEGAYEDGAEYGFPITPLIIRRQAYWSYLAGGHHSYGHNDNWHVNPTWQQTLDAPGARHLAILHGIFTARRWWELLPDQSVIVDGAGEGDSRHVSARSTTGDWLLVYFSHPGTITLRLDAITAAGTLTASWIDPTTGTVTVIGKYAASGTQSFTSPAGADDAILVMEAGD